MNKLMASFFIVLMLVGCSSNNSLTSDGDHVESTPEKVRKLYCLHQRFLQAQSHYQLQASRRLKHI